MIRNHKLFSLKDQFELLNLSKSGFYYKPRENEDFFLIKKIDQIYTDCPFYGSRRICAVLRQEDLAINRKHVQRLMRVMGIEAIYQKPRLSLSNKEHKIYPYLLRGLVIDKPNQVWATDITYIPMPLGHLYLIAIMDWHSRYVLSWCLSNSMEVEFCISALNEALCANHPEIFNTDQGSQFTSNDFTKLLLDNQIKISMDGKGRYLDNIFIERLWRSVKYEEVYIKAYNSVKEARESLNKYFLFYNNKRPHQALNYQTPFQVYKNKT